jgi:hypothetical protein
MVMSTPSVEDTGIVKLDEPEEEAPGQEEDEALDTINILPLLLRLAPEWIAKQAKLVVKNAKDDNDSRADYMKRYGNQLKLYAGHVPSLGYPAQGAKAPAIMLMCKSILHSWARIVDQIVPAKGDVVKVNQSGPNDRARALVIERHMNWQLRHRMPDWATSQQVSILAWLMAGSTFRHYRWDPIANTHVVDHVPIDDFIVAYSVMDLHPQMKDVPRWTRVLRMARWELEAYAKTGYYSNVDAVFPKEEDEEEGSTSDGDVVPSPDTLDKDSPVREAADKIQGIEPPNVKDKDGLREVLEQHTRLRFPKSIGVEGLAGESKPVIIVVDKATQKPLSVTIREEADPVDQARYNEQMSAFQMATANAAASGGIADEALKPKPVRMQTVYRAIHFRLFPNPSGFYGMGLGSLLESSNELANVLSAEYMLSAKFYNMFCGFLARGTKEKRGDVQMAQGKFIETDLDPELLDKGIKVMDGRPPAEALMKVVEKLEENAEIGASVDILSGEKGASNETARGMMIRNSQAMALISVMTRLYLEPLKYELKLIAHGNSIHLDEFELFPFVEDVPGQPGQQKVTQQKVKRTDYLEDVHIEFTADARMISKPERIMEAKDAIQLIMSIPQAAQNPMLVDFALREYFTVSEMIQYIAAMGPPPAPPPPPQPQSQEVENAGFFNETDHPVLPDDNHALHVHRINELKASPLFKEMSSTGKQMLDRHHRAHVGALYLQGQAAKEEGQADVDSVLAQVIGGSGGMGAGPPSGGVPGEMGGEAGGGSPVPPGQGEGGQP